MLPLLLCAQLPTPARLMEGLVSAERAHKAQAVRITATTLTNGKSSRTDYDLSFIRPGKLRLRVDSKDSSRAYLFGPGSVVIYDRGLNQYLSKIIRPVQGIGDEVGAVIGALEQ